MADRPAGSGSGSGLTGAGGDGSQFLTFVLGSEEYGLDILRVQEIRGYSAITAIPNTPPYIKGVMNLRGAVVPVLDLRAKFGMPEVEYNKFTVIIVVTVGTRIAGLVVDAVSDVLNIARTEIETPPELETTVDSSFITGLAKAADKLILLLDIERIVGSAEVAALGRAA
jgi:purine-binding chemotaxis protein CheW